MQKRDQARGDIHRIRGRCWPVGHGFEPRGQPQHRRLARKMSELGGFFPGVDTESREQREKGQWHSAGVNANRSKQEPVEVSPNRAQTSAHSRTPGFAASVRSARVTHNRRPAQPQGRAGVSSDRLLTCADCRYPSPGGSASTRSISTHRATSIAGKTGRLTTIRHPGVRCASVPTATRCVGRRPSSRTIRR